MRRKQKAVYWGSPSRDGYGTVTFADPVEIDCRWEYKREVFRTDRGREEVSSAVVYVGQDVDMGGMLYLGTLSSLGGVTDPKQADAFEIKAFGKVPNLKATKYTRKAWL